MGSNFKKLLILLCLSLISVSSFAAEVGVHWTIHNFLNVPLNYSIAGVSHTDKIQPSGTIKQNSNVTGYSGLIAQFPPCLKYKVTLMLAPKNGNPPCTLRFDTCVDRGNWNAAPLGPGFVNVPIVTTETKSPTICTATLKGDKRATGHTIYLDAEVK